eukprot:SAG11_NODE_5691_length_1485_cov_54.949495_2_plen_231_part_00
MDRADKAERELSEAQQEISDRTMIRYYEFEKPIPIRDIVCTLEQDFYDEQKEFPNGWSVCTDDQKCRFLTDNWIFPMCEKMELDDCSNLPNDLRHYLNFLFRESDENYASARVGDVRSRFAVFNFELNITTELQRRMSLEMFQRNGIIPSFKRYPLGCDGSFADGIEVLLHGETEVRVPKGCFRIIEKYLTHTLEEIANEPLEKVLSEIHELQTELGLTDYAFRDSSDDE